MDRDDKRECLIKLMTTFLISKCYSPEEAYLKAVIAADSGELL